MWVKIYFPNKFANENSQRWNYAVQHEKHFTCANTVGVILKTWWTPLKTCLFSATFNLWLNQPTDTIWGIKIVYFMQSVPAIRTTIYARNFRITNSNSILKHSIGEASGGKCHVRLASDSKIATHISRCNRWHGYKEEDGKGCHVGDEMSDVSKRIYIAMWIHLNVTLCHSSSSISILYISSKCQM